MSAHPLLSSVTSDTDHPPVPSTTGRVRRPLALVGFLVATQCAGLVGVATTERGAWFDQLEKPSFNPPSAVFAPVWTTLYALIGFAAWRVWALEDSKERSSALRWWAVQLALNAAWTPIFFGARNLGLALVDIVLLWFAIVLTITRFVRLDRVAGSLMAPYLAWVSFATALNAAFVALNR